MSIQLTEECSKKDSLNPVWVILPKISVNPWQEVLAVMNVELLEEILEKPLPGVTLQVPKSSIALAL